MEIIYNVDDEPIRQSRNLRGIRTHVSKNLVSEISLYQLSSSSGKMKIFFENGDHYTTNFASFSVLCDFVRKWRNVYGTPLFINGEKYGIINKNFHYEAN